MFALLAYSFITLFTGIAALGHVLLFRDIFFAPSDNAERAQRPQSYRGMQKTA